MKTAREHENNVVVLWVIVVARTLPVGGHDAAMINPMASAVFVVVTFVELNNSNLGNVTGLVCGHQRTGEQDISSHRLWSQRGIDATAA